MALWVCSGEAGCGTKYAVGLFRCPRCHGTEFHEEGSMPKITRHGGVSDATVDTPKEVPPSPGNSSETSHGKPSTSTEQSKPDRPKPAPTTGSRSRQDRTAGSSARSTAGAPTE